MNRHLKEEVEALVQEENERERIKKEEEQKRLEQEKRQRLIEEQKKEKRSDPEISEPTDIAAEITNPAKDALSDSANEPTDTTTEATNPPKDELSDSEPATRTSQQETIFAKFFNSLKPKKKDRLEPSTTTPTPNQESPQTYDKEPEPAPLLIPELSQSESNHTTQAQQPPSVTEEGGKGTFSSFITSLLPLPRKKEQEFKYAYPEDTNQEDNSVISKKQFSEAAIVRSLKTGQTALHKAINRNSLPFVKELARETEARYFADDEGNFPIHLAASKNSEFLKVLMPVDKEYDLNNLNNPLTGETVLHAAVKGDQIENVSVLMGGMINNQTKAVSSNKSTASQTKMAIGLSTPLHYVFYRESIVESILEKILAATEPSANLNLTNENGDTAAHLAVAHPGIGAINSVGLILKLVTSITPLSVNKNNQTILHLAAANKAITSTCFQAIVEALKQKDNTTNNIQDFMGNTPLHYAVNAGNSEKVSILLLTNPDIHLPNLKQETAFQAAVKRKDRMLLQLFFKHAGPIPEEMLKWAVETCLLDNEDECLKVLVENGANPNIAISLPTLDKPASKPLFNFSSTLSSSVQKNRSSIPYKMVARRRFSPSLCNSRKAPGLS